MLQRILEDSTEKYLQASAFVGSREDLETAIGDVIPGLVESTATSILSSIMRDAQSGLEANRRQRQEFEERLYGRWKKPLDLLELFVSIAKEAGDIFNSENGDEAVRSGNAVFEVLVRLHTRACQVSSAILVLLKSGYADDAHARWRSLHEISAVCYMVSRAGQKLAEKYLLHETVQQYKIAVEHRRYAGRIDAEPISVDEFEELRLQRDRLIEAFGDSFGEDYGWASSTVNKARPTVRDIEEHVGLDHMRPYYRMASDNVHANSHGAYFRMGLPDDADGILLVGPSDAGLADPGHSTAISLCQITTTLLLSRSVFDDLVISKILSALAEEVGDAFLEAHIDMERVSKH